MSRTAPASVASSRTAKGFAILVELRVVAAGPPARENLLYRPDIDAEEIGEWFEIRCK
jgi:hypothetical protein